MVTQTPKCPKCGGTEFGLKELEIKDERVRHNAVICLKCGSIVSTEECHNTTRMLEKIARKLDVKL